MSSIDGLSARGKAQHGRAKLRASDVVFVGALVDRCRGLLPLLQEHLDEYEGVLPHVLMGDVTRWAVDRFVRFGSNDDELAQLLRCLELAFEEGDAGTRELISVSFLENLPRRSEPGGDLGASLGQALKEELALIG